MRGDTTPPTDSDPAVADGARHAEAPAGTRAPWSAEAVLERGHWQRASEPEAGTPAALGWRPHLRLRERLRRAIAVPALAGIVVFAAAVAVAIGLTMARGQEVPAAAPAAIGEEHDVADGPEADGPEAASSTAPQGAEASDPEATNDAVGRVTVHVVGEVASAGVVSLPGGSRVSDAISAAGGATEAAALEAVNLARALVDGEQIVVPDAALAATWQPAPGQGGSGGAASSGAAGGAGAASAPAGAQSASGGALSLSRASVSDLDGLPRIGPALAQRIVDWRDAHGGFSSVEQLLDVPGIGERTLEGLRDLVVP